MSEHRGSCTPEPDAPEPGIAWHGQACVICARSDVVWTHSLRPGASARGSFALPGRIYLCDDCRTLVEARDDRALAGRLRSASGDRPGPETIVRALREALTGQPVHR